MNIGDLIIVNGRLATTTSESYTRMVYDDYDMELGRSGYEGGSACSFVNVVYNDSGARGSINISRSNYEVIS